MIRVRNLSKSFGNLAVLKNISTDIHKGEIISIIGPSGVGKSTFLRCLNLLETPTGGEIIVNGIHLLDRKTNVCELRKRMGMVFQSFNLFSHLMVMENILLGPLTVLKMNRAAAFDEGMKLLTLVGLAEKADAYPDELSGGQKQRVAIARTLAMRPKIVLFDEPTSALDPAMTSEVLAVIRKLAQDGMTMMIVTHEMQFAQDISTRILYLDDGIIYEEGTPHQIFQVPQKDKTRIFIHNIKTFTFEIRSRHFDLYNLIANIEAFGQKQNLAGKQVHNIQLALEELIIHKLFVKSDNPFPVTVTVGHSGKKVEIELTLTYRGKAYNPFEDEDNTEDISMIIVRKLVKQNVFSCVQGENKLQIIL